MHYNAGEMRHATAHFVRNNTPAHPFGWAGVERYSDELAGFGRRANAARADLHFSRLAFLDNRHRLQVGVEAAARMPLGEADRIAEGRAFTAVSALCHERMPPKA